MYANIENKMTNHWNQKGVPHKCWEFHFVIDVRKAGLSEWEADYETV